MTIKTKICGLKDRSNLDVAIEAGADFVGFVFFPKSPRNIELTEAADLVKYAGKRVQSVALTVNASDEDLLKINSEVNPDWFQLHGSETPERVSEVKSLLKKPVLKALGVASAADIEKARQYRKCVDFLLFDAKPIADGKSLPGGNGITFDWTLLKNVENEMRFMLSGGLNPENVRSAIELTGAGAVDVSSGVEKSPGEKDPQLIRNFIAAAHSASKA
ncbi:MAG: phosphoribosylanthranilate isomerase [Methyloligellaceae bacterium]